MVLRPGALAFPKGPPTSVCPQEADSQWPLSTGNLDLEVQPLPRVEQWQQQHILQMRAPPRRPQSQQGL